MKLRLNLEASKRTSNVEITLEELGITEEQWKKLSEEERFILIEENVHDLAESPYWEVVKFTEI